MMILATLFVSLPIPRSPARGGLAGRGSRGAGVVSSLLRRCLFVASCVLPLLACAARPSPAEGSVASATGYPADAPAEWDRLFNAHDASGLVALYTDAALSMPPGVPSVRGRKAIEAEFVKFFEENLNARHETRVTEVLTGDGWTIERADYTLTFAPRATGKPVTETGRHVMFRKREGGAWLIAWEIWNTDRPAE